jgi:cytochrome b561
MSIFRNAKLPLLIKLGFPFVQWYLLMILIALMIDFILHYFQLEKVGRHLGVIGTILILFSFVYSLRKRKIIQSGSPKNFLMIHEYAAWFGSILILVHAGIHFNALLPWLAILLMLITIASGLVAKFLLKRATESLKARQLEFKNMEIKYEDAEKELFFDALTVDAIKEWRRFHMPITYLLAFTVLLHVVTILMFS